jgi:(2Fe-2S) ferredoxin
MPSRERYLFVCTNRRDADNPKGSCAQSGSEEVAKRMKELIKAKGYAATIRACTTSCLDLCESGVSVVQEPDHVAYGRVTLDDVEAIVEACARGAVLDHKVVHRPNPDKER